MAKVVALWRACDLVVPWNDPAKDIERKVQHSPECFLVGVLQGEIVATVMFGYDGHRGSVNYLAISPAHRNQGLAREFMQVVSERLTQLKCPKINLMVRRSNLRATQFYTAMDYTEEPVVVLGSRLISD